MEVERRKSAKRRGIAGLIAAVILFTLLFTVGLGFYINLSSQNTNLNQAENAELANEQAAASENLYVTAMINTTSRTLGFAVSNQGGVTTSIVAYFVTGANQTSSLPTVESTQGLPILLSPTQSCPVGFSPSNTQVNPCLDTGVECDSSALNQSCTIELVTSRGNVFPVTYYPATGQSGTSGGSGVAKQASVSEGIGLFSFNFSSFDSYYCQTTQNEYHYYYHESTCTPEIEAPATCGSLAVPCSGYNPPSPLTPSDTAFSFVIQNSDPCQRTIEFNTTNTVLTVTPPSDADGALTMPLATLQGSELNYTSDASLTLAYGQSVILYFVNDCSNNYYNFNDNCGGSASSYPYSVALTLYGATLAGTGLGTSGCPTGSYGQYFPLFTTTWQSG